MASKAEHGERGANGFIREVRENTRRYIDGLTAEIDSLRAQLKNIRNAGSDLTIEHERFFEQYAAVESQNESLASLYVATYRLHGDLRREAALSVIEEIITNLIGSEEIAIFESSPDDDTLTPAHVVGVDLERLGKIEVGEGTIGQVYASGTPYLAETNPGVGSSEDPAHSESQLTACYPLMIGGEPFGVVAIFRLLEQKPSLEPLDLEILDLLTTQAAPALYAATLHERFGNRLKEK
jgi:GAF domain-containing protein